MLISNLTIHGADGLGLTSQQVWLGHGNIHWKPIEHIWFGNKNYKKTRKKKEKKPNICCIWTEKVALFYMPSGVSHSRETEHICESSCRLYLYCLMLRFVWLALTTTRGFLSYNAGLLLIQSCIHIISAKHSPGEEPRARKETSVKCISNVLPPSCRGFISLFFPSYKSINK